MNPFSSLREYERFVYSLPASFRQIAQSTLVVQQRGRFYAELVGELRFRGGHRMAVYERLAWDEGPLTIVGYSYEVWRGGEKLYWYDSQPHPSVQALAETHPHHKHVPPDIKHHRALAPDLSFARPNLPFLIEEIALIAGG